jgi:DNA sulfur modification protein DndC
MAAQIDSGHEWLEPLMAFRDYLYEIRNNLAYRDDERRNGQQGVGPFTIAARKEILAKLLEVQNEVGKELITEAELCKIREIWSNDITAISERRFALSRPFSKEIQGAAK